MPHSLSRKKQLRQGAKSRHRNHGAKQEIKTRSKRLAEAIEEKDLEKAQAAFKIIVSCIDKAAKHHVIHRHKAARMQSKLASLLNSLKEGSAPA